MSKESEKQISKAIEDINRGYFSGAIDKLNLIKSFVSPSHPKLDEIWNEIKNRERKIYARYKEELDKINEKYKDATPMDQVEKVPQEVFQAESWKAQEFLATFKHLTEKYGL